MACNCNKNGKQVFQVVDTDGKVQYQSTRRAAAETVQKRYPGSEIRESS